MHRCRLHGSHSVQLLGGQIKHIRSETTTCERFRCTDKLYQGTPRNNRVR